MRTAGTFVGCFVTALLLSMTAVAQEKEAPPPQLIIALYEEL